VKGESHKKCAAIWCSHKDTDPCKLFRIPSLPPDLPKNASEQCQITHRVKIFTQHEFLDRLGLGQFCKTKDVWFCLCHPIEKKPFQIKCEVIVNDVAKTTVITQEIEHLPVPLGKQHAAILAVHMSKGLGQDHMAAHILDSVTCGNALLNQQMVEMSNIEAGLYPIESINHTMLGTCHS